MTITTTWANRWARIVISIPENGDFDAYQALFSVDARWWSPLFECKGSSAIRRRYEELMTAVPDLATQLRAVVVDPLADRAVFEITQTGTMTGDLAGPATTPRARRTQFLLHAVMMVDFDRSGEANAVRMYFDPGEAFGERSADRAAS